MVRDNKKRKITLMSRVKQYLQKKKKSGFTMIELLIVIAIIASLSVAGLFAFTSSLEKSRDATRKKDLEQIRVAFEDYYNDNNCYPDQTALSSCGSDFSPYLKTVPCDPRSDQPYYYVPLTDQCDGYRVYASLEDGGDVSISKVGCDGPDGCGWGEEYNYGIAAGTTVYDPAGPSGSDGTTVYVYACDSAGTCNRFEEGHPDLYGCPVTFQTPGCENQCDNSAYWCN